jgi:protoporphyrinogen oxidase
MNKVQPSLTGQSVKFLIIGAGPCGLGAAHRLHELGETDWLVVEKAAYAGGLATSFVDNQGFTWDVGGHVVHSHYPYFDQVFHQALGSKVLEHQRESWVWLYDRFVPYPFQNNLRYLPPAAQWDCLLGLLKLKTVAKLQRSVQSFQAWILASFGSGIAEHFLFPYNKKVWAYPLNKMNALWVGDRVATIKLSRVLKNIVFGYDDVAWGPNHVFYFPAKGGTGRLWQNIAAKLPESQLAFNQTITKIDANSHTVTLESGAIITYQHLISTLPLTELLTQTTWPASRSNWLKAAAIKRTNQALFHSTVHVVGIGMTGQPPPNLKTKCWLYYPEGTLPFFRVTVFSNYSPANVPRPGKTWSLMCEVAESVHLQRFVTGQNVDTTALVETVIAGLKQAQLITDKTKIVSTWTHTAWFGYPTPTLEREKVLHPTLRALEKLDIYSRGRFGAWKYEVSNMDHTFMQGVEVVNRLVKGEAEVTVWQPNQVNRHHS